METLASRVDTTSDSFRANDEQQRRLAAELHARLAAVAAGGPEGSRRRHLERGKLLPRDRVDTLLDEGSPFLEIAPLAAEGMYGGDSPGAGMIAGIGLVHGRHVLVVCNDATVKGGTYYPMTVKKHLRAQEVALENNLPCIYLVDSGGAFLPKQDDVFPDREHPTRHTAGPRRRRNWCASASRTACRARGRCWPIGSICRCRSCSCR